MTDNDLPDPDDLWEKAEALGKAAEEWDEARDALRQLKQNENLRSSTRQRLDFLCDMLGQIRSNDRPGERAFNTQQYASEVEEKVSKQESEEDT